MEVDTLAGSNADDLAQALISGRDNTQPGSVIANCLTLFGSNEGDCSMCTKPCLHPLSTEDLRLFFHNDGILVFDWIDDSTCIVVCKNPLVVSAVIKEYFHIVATDESGIEWYRSNKRADKVTETDEYGEKGKSITLYARSCLTSDIERKEKLKKAKMINSIIKRRRQQKKLKQMASKGKKNKKQKQKKAKRTCVVC